MEKENEDYYVIPENTHTSPPPMDRKWKFLGVGGD